MFKKMILSYLFALLFMTGCGLASVEEKTKDIHKEDVTDENKLNATINRVVDGDTVNINLNGTEETVRLLLVDTPETKHPNLPVQPFGPEASEFAVDMLAGKDIQIEMDGPERDNYDRLLGYIWVDGQNFNQLLLEQGLARYAYEYDPPYTHQAAMQEAEQKARDAEIGIWSVEGYVREDGFNDIDEVRETMANGNKDTVYYANCTEAREAGVTPLYEDDPGYGTHMDGDGDGIACE